ncbi:hypothetical protein [Oerskovia jenensis]|uniref:hypothetical protein n=1 Tax=Oerskovia jenensis TaxID=162169 RepID=UPI0036DBA477
MSQTTTTNRVWFLYNATRAIAERLGLTLDPIDGLPVTSPDNSTTSPAPDPTHHEFTGVAGHPDDDECTYRADGTDDTYCGAREASHVATVPAPASDTRRGDVARALLSTLGGYWCGDHMFDEDDDNDGVPDCCQVARLERARDLADVALAVLPAPPSREDVARAIGEDVFDFPEECAGDIELALDAADRVLALQPSLPVVDEQAVKEVAWREGEASGWSRAMRRMSDEPGVKRAENPYSAAGLRGGDPR